MRDLQASDAGFIKIYWYLKRDVFLAIADESRKRHIPFADHVSFEVSAFDASDAGMRASSTWRASPRRARRGGRNGWRCPGTSGHPNR